MKEKKIFYVTTPLYYVSSAPHVGTAYTTILADVMSAYRKMFGEKTFFLTGTDEHGTKIAEAAKNQNLEPKDFADKICTVFKETWKALNINYDYFIRTTDDYHVDAVKKVLQDLYEKGEIYLGSYKGEYCTPCERFWTFKDLKDNKCPDCNRQTYTLEEKNYFFKMSKYKDALVDHIKKNPGFIFPESRRNEILGFLQKPLEDLSISRPKERLAWGIEIPFDKKFVTYVWFDALLNYITGAGYLTDEEKFSSLWPADYHLIGKDILTTHAVYWCTMLMAIGLPLPKRILAHGWWLSKGDKMSKSRDNVVKPLDYAKTHGTDVFRYFLMREMSPGQDSNFTDEVFSKVVNSDLANDLGNLISRTTKMISNYCDSIVPTFADPGEKEIQIKTIGNQTIAIAKDHIIDDKINLALESIMEFVRSINKYIVEQEPWTLAKNPSDKKRLDTVLYTCLESIRLSVEFLKPVMPQKCKEAIYLLGADGLKKNLLSWGAMPGGSKVRETKGLFPRIK